MSYPSLVEILEAKLKEQDLREIEAKNRRISNRKRDKLASIDRIGDLEKKFTKRKQIKTANNLGMKFNSRGKGLVSNALQKAKEDLLMNEIQLEYDKLHSVSLGESNLPSLIAIDNPGWLSEERIAGLRLDTRGQHVKNDSLQNFPLVINQPNAFKKPTNTSLKFLPSQARNLDNF